MAPRSSSPNPANLYSFRGFVLDAEALELRDRRGGVVDLPPSAFDLILCLIRNRSRVVPKEELFQELWPGVFVNDNALAQCVWAARRALGDGGRDQEIIKNVRGRGYRFVAETTEGASARESPAGRTVERSMATRAAERSFIGRSEELGWLREGIRDASAGRGRIFLVSGDAGIGKTRLAEEAAAEAAASGFLSLEGRGYDDEGMPPFWPWKQILRAFDSELGQDTVRELAGAQAADLANLVPDLQRRLDRRETASGRDADDDRYYLFQALTEFLARSSARRPLWITLDDFHWADASSARTLKFMAPALARSRICVVVTFRPHELDALRASAVATVERQPCAARRELGGLEPESVKRLLETAGLPAACDVVERVSAVTAGNPLFVTQLAPLLTVDALDAQAVADRALPRALQDALGRRVDALDDRARSILRVAAVLGQTFRLSDVRRAAGFDTGVVLQVLGGLRERRIVREAPDQPGLYAFVHPLLRDAVYRGIGDAERAVLQRTVALAIEQACARWPAARLDELAHHYSEAAKVGVAEKALRYTRLAAERAFETLAFEESSRYYRKALAALDLCDAPDERVRCELLLGLAHALRGVGVDAKEVRSLFQEVADRARAIGDMDLFADAALGFAGGGPLRLGPLTELGVVDTVEVSLLGAAADALGSADSDKKALVLSWLARSLYHSSDSSRRMKAADEAVEMARRMGSDALLGVTLFHRQQILRTPHVLGRRLEDLTEVIRIAERISERELALDAHYERAWVFTQLARISEADADIQTAQSIADELRQPRYRRGLETWNLVHGYIRDNVDDVLARDFERSTPNRDERANQSFGLRLMMARYMQDRASETLPLSERYVEDLPLPVSWRCGLCSTYGIVGRMDDCRRLFEERAVTGFSGIPLTHDWLSCYVLLSNACWLLRDVDRAGPLREILRPFEGNVWVMGLGTFISGPVALALGELNCLLRDFRQAEHCYDVAEDRGARLRSPTLVAWARVARAQMLVERRSSGDPAAARALLDEARPVVARTGFAYLGRRVLDVERAL